MSITLFCLVKGNTTANAFSVKISRDEPVSELKKVIKAEKQNDFAGVDADKLKLWNVKIPDDQDDLLRNLTLNDGNELLATREIGDYWTNEPSKRHIHVLVEQPTKSRKFDNLSEEVYEPPNKRVKIDDEELNRFWRVLKNAKSKKNILRLSENARFLGKERGPFALLIRNCYHDLQNVVFDAKIDKLRITGNPGIGKSFFGYYLLYLLAKQDATVVYDNYKERNPIVFEGEDAFASNDIEIDTYLSDSSVWYIVDGKEPKSVNAKTILICSPKRNHYKHFDDYEGEVQIRYMPIWSWKEIKKCWKNLYRKKVDLKLAEELFSKWGGIPRYVLERANNKIHQKKLDSAIKSCNMDIFVDIGENSVERTITSHMLIHIHVSIPVKDDDELDKDELSRYTTEQLQLDRNGETPYMNTNIRFVSNYVLKRVTEELEIRIREKLRKKIKAGTGSSLLGRSFECVAHKILRNGGNFDVRPLEKYYGDNDDEDAKVSLTKQNITYFNKQDIDEIKDGMYYEALEENFPSVDSVITPNKVFQMTIAKVHPITMSGLKLLYDKFGGDSADHLIYYYFVVPERIYKVYNKQKFINTEGKVAQMIPSWIKRARCPICFKN